MVVAEENSSNVTTKIELEKDATFPLELKYESEKEIEKIEDSNENIVSPELEQYKEEKIIEIPIEKGIETGLEIQYTSLKLKEFPLKDSNLASYDKEIENVSLGITNLNLGDLQLYNTHVRILGYKKFKLIELKTREFRIALSVGLFDGNTLKRQGDYFKYEIFSGLKNVRLLSVIEIFKKIFLGEKISFQVKDLLVDISFENRIQYHKFILLEEGVKDYENIIKQLGITKGKNISEGIIDFYTLYLLKNYLEGKTKLDSWINFRLTNKNISSGDKIIFIKDHELKFRGIDYNLREKICIKNPIVDKEINFEKNEVSCYRKIVEIKLEKIKK